MNYTIRPVADQDAAFVVNIFNYYVRKSFAAFPDEAVGLDFFHRLKALSRSYPFYVIEADSTVIGFGLLRPYHSSPVFQRTAEVTYFIRPEHLRKGLGSRLLDLLTSDARKLGIETFVAILSSANPVSFQFHRKHGFQERGSLKRVGRKFGEDFDVIYMQKAIDHCQ